MILQNIIHKKFVEKKIEIYKADSQLYLKIIIYSKLRIELNRMNNNFYDNT